MEIPEYQQRMMVEKTELDEKLHKLKAFLESEAVEHVPAEEVGRMLRQSFAMSTYSSVLGERLAAIPRSD